MNPVYLFEGLSLLVACIFFYLGWRARQEHNKIIKRIKDRGYEIVEVKGDIETRE